MESRQSLTDYESSEVFDIIKPGRRVKTKGTGSKMSITTDDLVFAAGQAYVDSILACSAVSITPCDKI